METMPGEGQIYAVPVKSQPNVYIKNTSDSLAVLKSRQTDDDCSNQTLLKMTEDMSTYTINSNFNITKKDSFSETNNDGVDKSSNGCPLLHGNKPQQRTFVKDKTDCTNPVSVPHQNENRYRGKSLKTSYNKQTEVDNSGFANSKEAEMKMLAGVDYDNSGYLTPMDPPSYMESSLDFSSNEFPSSPTGSETSRNSFHKRSKPSQRLDSGVGDVESSQGSNCVVFSTSPSYTSDSMSNPRLSTQQEQHYEDIDQYSKTSVCQPQHQQHLPQHQQHLPHHQQHLPQHHQHLPQHQQHLPQHQQPRRSTDKFKEDSVRHGMRPLPHVDVPDVTHSDNDDSDPVINTSLAEAVSSPLHDPRVGSPLHDPRVGSPLHDPRVGSLPHTYMPLKTYKHQMESVTSAKVERCSCLFITIPLVILLISLTALSISIYVVVSKEIKSENFFMEQSETSQVSADINLTIGSLQQKVDDLIKENTALKNVLLAQQNNLTSYVEHKVTELSSQQQNLSYMLQLMDGKFDAEIANISLTPGPQGAPGVVNFSLCVHRTLSRSSPAHAVYATETSLLPSETEIEEYFVTFAYCTYSGATNAFLETQQNKTNNRMRYRCKCWGLVTNMSQTVCTTNIWMCPH